LFWIAIGTIPIGRIGFDSVLLGFLVIKHLISNEICIHFIKLDFLFIIFAVSWLIKDEYEIIHEFFSY
jgi:hypothetical protein